MRDVDIADRLAGVLIGTATGDALGLPYENLSRRRVRALVGGDGPLAFRFLPGGVGVVSDDTEHAALTALALAAAPRDPEGFERALARSLRWWLAAVPPGVGFATLRAVGKMWLGVRPSRCGVFSAGNGPAMRAPVIGAFHWSDEGLRRRCVRLSTRMTHTDPRAEIAAQAAAELAAAIVSGALPPGDWPRVEALLAAAPEAVEDCPAAAAEEWRRAVGCLSACAAQGAPLQAVADGLGCAEGVSGYAFHTVPVAAFAWWRHRGDLAGAASACVRLGGDTDSVAAVAGALVGAEGVRGVPERFGRIVDWPYGPAALARIGRALAAAPGGRELPEARWLWLLPVRNAAVTAVCIGHVARRLLPPYRPGRE